MTAIKHGDSLEPERTPEYRAWDSMIQRCTNPNRHQYEDYGGRGITICPQWFTYEVFLKDVGRKPSPEYTLDRIRNNEGYYPGNVKWSTRKEQRVNRREIEKKYRTVFGFTENDSDYEPII
jgi:hypothetical protein